MMPAAYPTSDCGTRWAFAAMGIALGLWLALAIQAKAAAEDAQVKTAAGLTGYLGVFPAELVKGPAPHSGEAPMHGRVPKGPHEFHLVIALFDAASGARISDALVTAKVSGLGLSGAQKTFEAMKIAETITYGAFFNLARDIYTVRITVQRPGAKPVVMDFKYDHRR